MKHIGIMVYSSLYLFFFLVEVFNLVKEHTGPNCQGQRIPVTHDDLEITAYFLIVIS